MLKYEMKCPKRPFESFRNRLNAKQKCEISFVHTVVREGLHLGNKKLNVYCTK